MVQTDCQSHPAVSSVNLVHEGDQEKPDRGQIDLSPCLPEK